MPKRISDDREWLLRHLTPLAGQGEVLLQQHPNLTRNASYEKGFWSALKLIALKYYVKPYLDILADRGKVAYVDLFAGPGLNLLGARKIPFVGSPLIPLMIREASAGRGFDLLIASEIDRVRFEALSARVNANLPSGTEASLHLGDANRLVTKVRAILDERDIGHCFIFIDPEGLDWEWKSMERLAQGLPCDIVVNFPSSGLQRNSTHVDAGTRATVARCLGIAPNEIPGPFSENWALQTYRDGLRGLGKDVSTEIAVRSEGSFHYHLIPAVRRTPAGSPWFKILEQLKARLERTRSKIPSIIAEQLTGKGQQALF